LLIEESRANLILQSENFASASWTEDGGSISSVANIEPDGSANSELFSENGADSTHRTFQAFTGVSGTSYTLSVFLKFAGRDQIFLENRSIGTNPFVVFNIQNGTIGFVSSGLTAAIQAYPNGWYRCSITGTATLAGGNYLIGGYSGGSKIYTGLNGPAFYLYGAQVEAGSFPTSYIPTTTATLTRSADVCSITGGDFNNFYNQSEGTMLTNAFTPASGDRTVLAADDNTANEMIRLRTEGTNPFFKVTDGGSELVAIDAGTVSANTSFKLIGAYKLDDFASSINGGAAVTDTSGTTPTVDRMRIGAGQGGNTMCGCVASLRYYKKRLPNAKLQALTA
jgi:hypothetical protein